MSPIGEIWQIKSALIYPTFNRGIPHSHNELIILLLELGGRFHCIILQYYLELVSRMRLQTLVTVIRV